MIWGEVGTEPEFDEWYVGLTEAESATADFYVDLLAEEGVLLGEPYSRQLSGKLRELRFHLGRQQIRISYFIATGRRIVLLTVFRKARYRERAEIARAARAMQRCVERGHTAEEDGQ